MGYQDFISETEAIGLAGVSAKTLQRFTDAGYLHVEIEPDGLRLYSRSEVNEIFGVHQGKAPTPAAATSDETPVAESPCGASELESAISCSASRATDEQVTQAEASPSYYSQISSDTPYASEPEHTIDSDMQQEVARLRNLVTLQERILDMKESEVADLRAQRDWLQRRVEKLEEKGDRDQILLLSETQTIRRLVTMQENKRSTVRQVLEWLGLTPAKQVPQIGAQSSYTKSDGAIEVREAANG
jgi:hypothetical protein